MKHSNGMILRYEPLVILGADAVPYGPSVVRDFQKNGYIVLASVFSGEAADDLERDTEGYVRALVLDAEEVSQLTFWSLKSNICAKRNSCREVFIAWFYPAFPALAEFNVVPAFPDYCSWRSISINDYFSKHIARAGRFCHFIPISR